MNCLARNPAGYWNKEVTMDRQIADRMKAAGVQLNVDKTTVLAIFKPCIVLYYIISRQIREVCVLSSHRAVMSLGCLCMCFSFLYHTDMICGAHSKCLAVRLSDSNV